MDFLKNSRKKTWWSFYNNPQESLECLEALFKEFTEELLKNKQKKNLLEKFLNSKGIQGESFSEVLHDIQQYLRILQKLLDWLWQLIWKIFSGPFWSSSVETFVSFLRTISRQILRKTFSSISQRTSGETSEGFSGKILEEMPWKKILEEMHLEKLSHAHLNNSEILKETSGKHY